MFVYRTTWIVKQGMMEEALALASETIEQGKPQGVQARVYTPYIGPNEFVLEEVWETIEAHDQFWQGFNQSSQGETFYANWNELVERSVSTYVWNVKEWR